MALYAKQDFCPRILTRKWFATKMRPNMLLYSRQHVLSILESGLLFREDSADVEQEAATMEVRGARPTRGEGAVAIAAVAVCVAVFPPRSFTRSSLLNLAAYLAIPLAVCATHRTLARGTLASMLANMRAYFALARRTAACLKEYAALHAQIGSVHACISNCHALLVRQQTELARRGARALAALLGNAPWLRGDLAWDALANADSGDLQKIHHTFLVVQSSLLKHIALAHCAPPNSRLYRNHNERVHWLHHVLIAEMDAEYKENHDVLERMYRLLRNFSSNESSTGKKPGPAMLDTWVYSEIHNGVARTNLELKVVGNKCNALDALLDSCALHKQELDLSTLEKDLDDIISDITKCLSTMQNSQIRLKKIKSKVVGVEKIPITEKEESDCDDGAIVNIDDTVPEVKDEVFYFVKTEDDDVTTPVCDITTAPGKKEKEATKIVLKELKSKLGKREDVMRERERQALVKTMPELRDRVPEFPRQIDFEEFVERKGFLAKTKKERKKSRLFRDYKIKKRLKDKKYTLRKCVYIHGDDIAKPTYVANSKLNVKNKLVSISSPGCLVQWVEVMFSDQSESDAESGILKNIRKTVNNNKNINKYDAKNFTFTKKDLELSSSSSESDFEFYKAKQLALLKDIRRQRAARRKNHPSKRASIDKTVDKEDESMKPIEYSFGTGMAMASVLQINSKAKLPKFVQEEVFIGAGEVSNDSGNDEDA